MTKKWFSPYDNQRRIGSVIDVQPTQIKINLTLAGRGAAHFVHGEQLRVGEINEYVFIDTGTITILGKIIRVWLEGAERLSVEALHNKPQDNHPIGLVQPLITVQVASGKVQRGISQYPRLAAQVYAAHPDLIALILSNKTNNDFINLAIGFLPNHENIKINATPEQLFTRHCGIFGSTGSGKSNTVAKLLELITSNNGKALLIDATGEYQGLDNCETFYIGNKTATEEKDRLIFPYLDFSDSDLYALLRPSGQVQLPKLIEAIRSLKAVTIRNTNDQSWIKKNTLIDVFTQTANQTTPTTKWSFASLAKQVEHECVWPTDKANPATKFGSDDASTLGYCVSLMGRINVLNNNSNMKWFVTQPADPTNTVKAKIADFLNNGNGILRLDLSAIPYESNAREILVNAIGRCLLDECRNDVITRENPLLVFIDEAHQFLNKFIGEDTNKFTLDAFGNIAKEGRKYGLNIVIATQRPRDIPEDVLSQIGTFFVHRLTNPYDQEIVKKAIGDLDQSTANTLPVLGTGEALLLGIDFNFPIRLKISQAAKQPCSESVNYSNHWIRKKEEATKK